MIKRPSFITTVPRGVFLQPQQNLRGTVTKRHVYAFSSSPRILEQDQRGELIKQNSSHDSNQLSYRIANLVNKNSRPSLIYDNGPCRVSGVKILRTR